MSTYGEGAVTIQVGSSTVLGTGTKFGNYAGVNYVFRIRDEDTFYIINSVNSATNLTLTGAYENANAANGDIFSNIAYQIVINYTPNRRLPEMAPTDTNVSYIYTRAMRMLDNMLADTASSNYLGFTTEDNASITGTASDLYTGTLATSIFIA